MTGLDASLDPRARMRAGEASPPRAGEILIASLVLAVLLLAFFLNPILRREILSPADLLLKSAPWRQNVAADFEPANSLLSDYVYQMRPWRAMTVASLKARHIPLWDPYNYAGAPFLGNGQSAVLYPLNLIFLVLPETQAVLLGAIARLFIAGLSAYVFARVIGLSVLGGAMTSLGFGFCGFLVVWLLYPIGGNVAIWLPALFLTAEALVRRPTISRMLLTASIVWIQFLGGHPGTSLQMLSAVGLYVVWRTCMMFREETDRRRLARRLVVFAGAVVLGAAGAAVQLLPLAEYILESAALRVRLSMSPPLWLLPRPRLLAMVALVCPYCFGSHLRGDLPLGVFFNDVGNFNELNGGYVGLASLVLVGIAIVLGARRGIDLFFIILGGVAFCVAYAIPPVFNLIRAVPLLGFSSIQRMLLLQAFALSVLAGRGADLLLAAPDSRAGRIVKSAQVILLAGIVATSILTVGGLGAILSFRGEILEAAKARIVGRAGKETFRQDPEHYLALLPRYYDRSIGLLIREGTGRVVLLALTGIAIGLCVRPGRGRWSLTWMLPGVVVLDLFSFGRDYNPSIPAHLEYPAHGAIEFVQRQPGVFRILGLDGGFPPNTNVIYGLSEIRGYNVLETEAYHHFLAATGDFPQPHGHIPTLYFSNFESRLVDLLNVKYLISDRELRHPKLTLVWEGTSRVYQNLSVMPRAFLVYRTQVLGDTREMERALRSPEFDPSEVVLFERTGPALSGPADPSPTVQIIEYQPERVLIEVSSRYDAMLVLADSWFPGWKATVDGVSTAISRGNLIFRAIPVGAGNHRIVFQYDPASFRLGVLMSTSALLTGILLALTGPLLRRWRGEKLS